MKPHLPISLRNALLACFAAVASLTLGATVATSGTGSESGEPADSTITIDYANPTTTIPQANGALQLTPITSQHSGTPLKLVNTGEGDGKTYTLYTGVTRLVDAEGNTITLDSTNNAISNYFDTTQPGSGFWAGGTLQLTTDGTLQLVRHNETVKDALVITSRRSNPKAYTHYKSITFKDIESSSSGGAICQWDSGTIRLSNNGSVVFSGNTASASSSDASGGAIDGGYDSTITLSNNGRVEFIGNNASGDYACGGAIYGGYDSTITLSDNGSVTFIGNTASYSDFFAHGGAIDGSTIMLNNNGSVTFSGNTASGYSSDGGAIYGGENSTITLSNNGSVKFNGNTASYGGAIYTYHGSLHIRNNDSVEFAGNVEKRGSSYRLRSVCVYGGSDDVLNISSAAGKKVAFYDSIYVDSDATVNLNADYADAAGHIIKQQGDIIFSGATTEDDLYKAKGNVAGTAEEILNSRTTKVETMTNLYGGRLRVEEGAIYQGQGITAHEGSGATVRVKDATLSHSGYDLTFNAGTTLELAGMNSITGNVQMLEGSILSFDGTETQGVTCLTGNLGFTGAPIVSLGDTPAWTGENHALLYVNGTISGWDADTLTVLGSAYGSDNLYCLNNDLLVLNYDAETFNPHFRGDIVITSRQQGPAVYKYFADVSFENIMGASNGGAIYGGSDSTIMLSNNGSVEFSGYTASFSGGAIDGGSDSTITLSDNGSVTFSGNSAFRGGAILADGNLSICNNDSVLFEKNAEIEYNTYRLRSIYAGGSGDIISLSAAEGKGIEFRDALYIYFDSTVELNADYTDAEGVIHKQTGDIIFTGAYTEQHLNELLAADGLNRTATEAEILNSRTTTVYAMTNLYGGRLRVEDGAIYKGYGITAMENSAATVLVKDATLDHAGYNLVFHSGTTLELVGDNVVSANRLQMHTDSSLIFRENAGLVLDGTLNVQGEGTLLLENGSLSAHKIDGTGGISITGGSLELQDDTDALAVDGAVRISNTTLSGNWCGEGLTVDGVSVAADAEISLKNLTLKSVLSNEGALVLGGEVSIASEVFGFVGGDVQYSAGASGYRYVVHDYTLVEGCGQITAAADVIWKITENGADQDYQSYSYTNGVLTAKKILDATTYWVNDAVTYDGRSEFDSATTLVLNGGNLTMSKGLGTNLTGGIRVDAASTLSLSSGVEVKRAQLSGVSADNTVSLDGSGKLNLGSSADFTGYALAKGWSGTVKLENITTDTNLDMNTIGQSGSKIELENVMGYTGVNGGTVAADLQLNRSTAADGTEQAALVISNGSSHKTKADHVMTTFSGTVSGAGKMVYEKTLSNEYTGFAFSGDVSGWTGAFEMNGGKTFNLVFNGKATEIKADIRDVSSGGTLNLVLGADAAMTLSGAIDTDSITVSNAAGASFCNTVSTGTLSAAGSAVTFGAAATVSGDMNATAVVLNQGGSLDVGGSLKAAQVTLKELSTTAPTLTVGSFAAGDTIFSLDVDSLNALNLGHGQSVVIARADSAIGSDFSAWLAEDSTTLDAVVYRYDLSVSGSDVMVSMDYANWGTRIWYGNAWVGKESWKEYMTAGHDAVNGVETVDLGGADIVADGLYIAPDSSSVMTVLSNGMITAEYAEVANGKLTIAEDVELETPELAADGREILLQGELIVSGDGSIGQLSGTEGTLEIYGKLSVDGDVTLGSLVNGGTLDMGTHKLNVAGACSYAGNVTAGEVVMHNRTNNYVEFDTLVADKVKVTNASSSASYSDNISVGDGSAIGELVAEKLQVREGTVTLGRSTGGTEMSLLNLDLQEDATLVLNQQTALAVTDTLTATENATVQLKKDASICYGDTSISNRNESGTVDVNAYALSGKADLVLERAHVSTRSSSAKVMDYQLINSSVENAGTGTLQLTHAGNSLTSIAATSGSVEVYNQAELNLEHLSIGRNQSLAVMSSDVAAGVDEEFEARVNIFGSATFGADSTLIADLSIQSGATIRIEGVVHMGSSITLSSGMVLAGAALENALSLNVAGDYVVLFDGVDSLILDGETPLVYSPGGLTVDDKVLASKYFMGLEEMENLYITFEENSDSESGNSSGGEVRLTLGSEVIPEPTTSTLSLLALAALAARRRRN